MSLSSIVLLENTSDALTVTGEPLRTDDGFGHAGHRFTVAIHTSNLIGTVHIEATLADRPEETDWFQAIAPISFPRPGAILTTSGETAAIGVNFAGNYAWIRARLSRDGAAPVSTADPSPYGFIDRILLNR